jgi:RNA 3'-terminal phosphate cyclase (ATP)
MVAIDGSHGEGGGQVLRTTLALAALTGQPVHIESIRAGRKNPGLQAQHLTAILAAARICDAAVEGARLGSQTLTFTPGRPPQAGEYRFDVSEQRKGGSAGAATLVLHTLLLPLAWADGPSRVTVRGGTHVPWSPPYQHLERVYLPMLKQMGIAARAHIARWGWYPQGGGEVMVEVEGIPGRKLSPLQLLEHGEVRRLRGLSAYANLPDHVGERQARQAEKVLGQAGLPLSVQVYDATPRREGGGGSGIGTAVMLFAEGEGWTAGFSALGERGKPAERVAEEACFDLLRWWRSAAVVEMYLADQLLLPLALAGGPSTYTTCRVTRHLLTNAWAVERLLPVRVAVEGGEGEPGKVQVRPG